ncbi:chloride channel protein [Alkalispirochaeta alkalica]|uniref:chloride channel protein n=1 Tax=Alkalispirochaeta alkalica TaxID=46356 RepID=UPI00036D5250|nr:chloride channel protein [Alkalispirochaeta alkalica]
MINRWVRFAVLQTLILLTTGKWVILAALAGVVVGIPVAAFLILLDAGTGVVRQWQWYFLLVPLGLFLSSFLVNWLAPDAQGHGTEKVIEALHEKEGMMRLRVIPVKMVATLITLILGGSAGKEGPSAQIGAGVASGVASLLRMTPIDRQRFVQCGISAGFSGVFGTPIAAALFAAEVLHIGRFSYNRFLPSLIASYSALMVTRALGVRHLSYTVPLEIETEIIMLLHMVGFGALLGLMAILLVSGLNRTEHLIGGIPLWKPLKGALAGLVLVGIVFLTGTTNYLGVGTGVVDAALDGQAFRGIAPFFKIITTSLTLGSGGSGGILGPIFFIGATSGNYWAQLLGQNVGMFSAIGMVAFLAAAANTPIAAIMMAMELFGVATGSYAAVACAVAYLVVGHVSVYPSQIIHQKKPFFMDLEVHQVEQVFDRRGISNLFRCFFRGYRDNPGRGLSLEGKTIEEESLGSGTTTDDRMDF